MNPPPVAMSPSPEAGYPEASATQASLPATLSMQLTAHAASFLRSSLSEFFASISPAFTFSFCARKGAASWMRCAMSPSTPHAALTTPSSRSSTGKEKMCCVKRMMCSTYGLSVCTCACSPWKMPAYASRMEVRRALMCSISSSSCVSSSPSSSLEASEACCSMVMTCARYFSKPPCSASAMSPKQERMAGLTERCSVGEDTLCSSASTIWSHIAGGSCAPSARHRSPTVPTATLHTWYSWKFLRPLSRKG
mmetsp:Transcript_14784/g.31759  ORF Transcript_14784/g.31759 Transcript_14784/m.31759 type:complete len:251 (+) Transcript_14784:264-1016(+)